MRVVAGRFLANELGTSVQQLTDPPKYHAMIKLLDHDARYVSTFPPTENETRIVGGRGRQHSRSTFQAPPAPQEEAGRG